MTKAEIVQALYTRVGGFSKKESADIVDLVFEMMKETLGRGEKIKISGFGNFVLRDKRQRPGRNPQTGDPIKISERRVLTFKASQILKLALNGKEKNGNEPQPQPRTTTLAGTGGGNGSDGLGRLASSASSGASALSTGSVGTTPAASGMVAPLSAAASEAPKE
jgi:integration host factor subunit alpha